MVYLWEEGCAHFYTQATHTYPLSLSHTLFLGNPEEKEEGGAVYEVLDSRGRPVEKGEEVESGKVTLSFGR